MTTRDIQQVAGSLTEILDKLSPGEEVIVTRNDQPIATIRAAEPVQRKPRRAPQFGTMRGSILYIAPDFDEIPEGFEEYPP